MKKIKDYLSFKLEDDSTEKGGIEFIGETVEDFIQDTSLTENSSIADLNVLLEDNGIKKLN